MAEKWKNYSLMSKARGGSLSDKFSTLVRNLHLASTYSKIATVHRFITKLHREAKNQSKKPVCRKESRDEPGTGARKYFLKYMKDFAICRQAGEKPELSKPPHVVHRKWWAKRKPLECHLHVCEQCFEVTKGLYDHQHDAQHSDHIFNLPQLQKPQRKTKFRSITNGCP
ncbi:hypothetical protein Bca4012_019866 [Brassica carinata]